MKKDLLVLVADSNMKYAISGILQRNEAIGTRSVGFDVIKHPNRDGGVRSSGVQLVELERSSYDKVLMVLDFEGSGTDLLEASLLEEALDKELEKSTWFGHSKAIVIDPELEQWVWGSDNALQQIFGRPDDLPIRSWLQGNGFEIKSNSKPERPKEAFEALLKKLRIPRSSALYEEVLHKISLKRCTDPSFVRLRRQLQMWFPTVEGG